MTTGQPGPEDEPMQLRSERRWSRGHVRGDVIKPAGDVRRPNSKFGGAQREANAHSVVCSIHAHYIIVWGILSCVHYACERRLLLLLRKRSEWRLVTYCEPLTATIVSVVH